MVFVCPQLISDSISRCCFCRKNWCHSIILTSSFMSSHAQKTSLRHCAHCVLNAAIFINIEHGLYYNREQKLSFTMHQSHHWKAPDLSKCYEFTLTNAFCFQTFSCVTKTDGIQYWESPTNKIPQLAFNTICILGCSTEMLSFQPISDERKHLLCPLSLCIWWNTVVP